MTLFQRELMLMFQGNTVMQRMAFSGTSAVGYLDDELRVKLRFSADGMQDYYNGIHVSIINRTEGVIDEETFRFKDVIGMQKGELGEHEPYIFIKGESAMWASPVLVTDKNKIAEAVLNYVEIYQNQEMGLVGPCY